MIKISVNGEIKEISEDLNVNELIDELGYTTKGFAVAVNTTFVAIDTYANTIIKENDKIDILAPVQGG
jgi:sulfur carrier protein